MGKDGEYITHFAYGTPASQMTEKLCVATFSRAADPPHLTVIVAPQHKITISFAMQHLCCTSVRREVDPCFTICTS